MTEFDAIVIGAVPAGEVCAGRLGENGLSVAVVESDLVGGECSYYGCMPSKALLRPQEALDEARRIPGAAEAVSGRLDVATVLRRCDVVVLGGSVGGVELGQAWSTLGSQVTIVEGGPRVLAREEEFASRLVHDALAARGVQIHTGSPATLVERGNGGVRVTLGTGEVVEGDEILVGVGRRPNTADLGLESVGLEPGRYVTVDDSLRAAGSEWLYAIGDVNGRALLTHMGKYQGRIAADA